MPASPMPLPSPCINVCRMVPALGLCEGCGRSIDEIASWGSLDERQRWAVWKLLPARKEKLAQALFGDAPAPAASRAPSKRN